MQIDWNKRTNGHNIPAATVSIDCTDFHILEQKPFDFKSFWFKFNSPGLRYGIAILIRIYTGEAFWAHSPFECSIYNEWAIFKLKL